MRHALTRFAIGCLAIVCAGAVAVLALFAPSPTNLRATITGTTVQVDWDQPPTASAWQVEAGSAPGLTDLAVFRTAARTLMLPVVPSGRYYVRVRSATPDFSDVSEPSNEIVLPVGCAGYRPPRDLRALVSGNTVMLSWLPPSHEIDASTSYILEVGSSIGQSDLLVYDTRSSATSLQATAPNGTYYVRVRTRTSCGTSGSMETSDLRVVVPAQSSLPLAPVAEFTFGRFAAGSTCSYRGCLFDAFLSSGTGLTYSWDFADGSTGTGPVVLHVYARPPFYRQMTVVLTVTDALGRSDTKAKNIYLDPNY
jgi:hypothetical protein